MQCKFCRGDIPEGAKVCPVCGTPVPTEEKAGPEQNITSEQNAAPEQDAMANQNQQYQYQYGTNGDNNQGQQYQYGVNPGMQNNQPNYNQGAYNQPNYNQPNYGQGDKPINGTPYMVFAILSTLFCCLPLGIASIVFASKINTLQKIGDYEGAKAAAKKAKTFIIIGAVIGLIVSIIYGVWIGSSVKDAMDSDSKNGTANTKIEFPVDDDEEDDDEKPKEPVEASKDLGDSWNSYAVQLNGTTITLPCSITDIEALGLYLDTEETPEDYMVNPGEYEIAFMENEEDNYIMVDMINDTDEAVKIVDCKVGSIYVDSWATADGDITFVLPGGVQIGMSKDDMLAAYGEPDDLYEGDSLHSYTWYEGDSYYKSLVIDIDAETGLVSGINLQAYEF